METSDVLILGGGIVGLATAYELSCQHPQSSILVLEKESHVAEHQTGHNSGVLHSGIYYKPGSLKAENCRLGKQAMEAFCQQYGLPYETCGKVIVATTHAELPALQKIYERGQQNKIACELMTPAQLYEREPHVTGVQAIYVPSTGIVNYRSVTEKMAELVQKKNGNVLLNAEVLKIRKAGLLRVVETNRGEFAAKHLINCTGLHCDRVAKLAGLHPTTQIVPFRGEYYELKPEAQQYCRHLIYPVPDAQFPFLGVHFTRMIQGGVECGPNAVLAFAREGYHVSHVNLQDLLETLAFPGFRKLAAQHWQMGCGEMWRSLSKAAFVQALQKLIPEIRSEHLTVGRAGVRAQAVTQEGTLVDDFAILQEDNMIHVLNAPSPAATASLTIGQTIVHCLERMWSGK